MSQVDDLSQLYGVGRKTKEKLLGKFASPEDAYRAIKKRDVDAFLKLGFSTKFTIDLIRKVTTHGYKFLQSQDARKEYKKILKIVLNYAHTPGARNLLKLLTPLGTQRAIDRRSNQVLAAKNYLASLSPKTLKKIDAAFTKGLATPPKWETIGDTTGVVVVTDSTQALAQYGKRYETRYYTNLDELGMIYHEVPFLRLVTEKEASGDEGILAFLTKDPLEEVIPESVIEEFARVECDLKLYHALANLLPDRFRAANEVAAIVQALEKPDPKLAKVLKVEESWPDKLDSILDKAAELSKRGISGYDLSTIVTEELGITLPLPDAEIPSTQVEEVIQRGFERVLGETRYHRAAQVTRAIGKYRNALADYQREVQMLDYWLALGRFAVDFQLNMPHFSQGDTLYLREARNLYLQVEEHKKKLQVDPVDYILGNPPESIPGVQGERLSLLTGANSGGKSCLLETVFQAVLLAYMGLLVPAEYSIIPPLDSIIYHRRHSSRTAGALESALKKFVPEFVKASHKKLVLIDEFEAITEPGGAARILIGLINLLIPRKVMGVFVTHLSHEVANLTGPSVRVDSIVASGLDDELNLITSHQPVFGQAGRSTPEFIVQKLAARASSKSIQNAYGTIKTALQQNKIIWQTRIDWYLDKLQVKKKLSQVPTEVDLPQSPRERP